MLSAQGCSYKIGSVLLQDLPSDFGLSAVAFFLLKHQWIDTPPLLAKLDSTERGEDCGPSRNGKLGVAAAIW
jgi:hypothetical protein